MTNLSENQPTTFAEVLASLKETSQLQKENERILIERFAETERMMKENDARDDRRREKIAAEAEVRFKEAEVRLRELERLKEEVWQQIRETDKQLKKTGIQIEENNKQIGGMGNSNGKIAEAYFVNSFTKSLYFAGQEFDSISSDLKKNIKKLNLKDQYDIVLYNGTSVVIIEVKYTAEKKNVEQTLKKAQTFKQLFPEYAQFDLYLGLAGLHFDEEVENEAALQGIAVIKQVGDSVVINDQDLTVF
jgi:hypothetical protein